MHNTSTATTHIVGFGSQAQAWALNLKDSDPTQIPTVYLPATSRSHDLCRQHGLDSQSLDRLPAAIAATADTHHIVALLIPDHHIGSFYNSYLAPLHNHQITVVLAHGYAVFNGSLIPQSPTHAIALLAPKAIGPELRRHFCQHRAKAGPGATHSLKAAYHYPTHIGNTRQQHFEALTRSLGFASDNLIPCPPETEALADLISEQGLLCGGLFTLLAWTMQTMKDSAIPQALIQEECITELKLIANLLQERGPVGTLDAISQAAAAGAALMSQELNQPAIKNVFMDQLAKIKSGEFVREYESGHWKEPLASLKQSLNQESSPNP